MKIPAFMDPYRANTPAFGIALLAGAALVGVYAMSGHGHTTSRATSDDEYGFDCRVQGNRQCGSDVTGQDPGTYRAPDGKDYTVVYVSPYDACVHAANTPGPSGFATEVCEPLAPDYEAPSAWLTPADFAGGRCLFFSWRQIDPLTTKPLGTGIDYCPRGKP